MDGLWTVLIQSASAVRKPEHVYTPMEPIEAPEGWRGPRGWDIPMQTRHVDPIQHPQR